MERWIQRMWLARPGPDAVIDAVVLFFIQCCVEDEIADFSRVRFLVERHAEGLRRGDKDFAVEHLEQLMTRCHRMTIVLFDHQSLLEEIEFMRTRVFSLESQEARYRQGVRAVRNRREGVEQVQRRMEELQRQHLMDQQTLSENRLRMLTIVSAIFLPLTLISGIYGMNFEHMPELDEHNAYFVVLGTMGAVALAMISFFHWKGWFR